MSPRSGRMAIVDEIAKPTRATMERHRGNTRYSFGSSCSGGYVVRPSKPALSVDLSIRSARLLIASCGGRFLRRLRNG